MWHSTYEAEFYPDGKENEGAGDHRAPSSASTKSGLFFTVTNKKLSLEQVLQDKLHQRSSGGGHEAFRKFKMLDRDGSGALDRDEIRHFLGAYNILLDDSHLDELFSRYNADGDGSIDFYEFMHQVSPEDFPDQADVKEMFAGPIEPIAQLVAGRIVNERQWG